jgi:O-antigen ligase
LLTQSITAYLTVGVLGSLAIGGLGRSYIISHSSRSTQKMGTFILTGAALFIIGMIILTMNLPKFQNLFDPMSRNSLSARLEIWHATSVMIKSNSLFGIGLADFPRVYQQVIPTLYFPPLEWLVPEPHNVFLAFWVHSGIFGLIIFIWILLRYIKLGGGIFQLIKSPKRALFFITLLSFYIQGILDTTFWKNDLAILFMLTILYIDTYLFIEEEVDT